jgi:hypothetical protein
VLHELIKLRFWHARADWPQACRDLTLNALKASFLRFPMSPLHERH